MKKKKKNKIIFEFSVLYLILLIILILGAGILIGTKINQYNFNLKFNNINNFDECVNLSVSETTICLRNYVKGFYNYKFRNETNYIINQGTLEDVKENGGDCTDYSNMYKDMAIDLGLKARTVSFYPDEGIGHMFTVIWDANRTEYCVIDMLNILKCVKLSKTEVEN